LLKSFAGQDDRALEVGIIRLNFGRQNA
jgi:hypothetical protein